MCGRYYIDETLLPEIEAVIGMPESRLKGDFRERDIFPSQEAPVIAPLLGNMAEKRADIMMCRWGIPGFDGKKLIFNARAETAADKRMFRDGLCRRRIAVPGRSFYEWNRRKEKFVFSHPDGRALFFAGFCVSGGGEESFVILTTEANESMRPVHGRMPLLLERDEIMAWITPDADWDMLLRKRPGMLERKTDYEQLTLF